MLDTTINVPRYVFNQAESKIADGLFCAIDKQRNILYILDLVEEKVFKTDYEAKSMKEIIKSSYIKYSTDISFNEAEQLISISNSEENTVMIFGIDGVMAAVYAMNRGIGEGQMNKPVSSGIINGKYILFVDSLNCKIQLFDNNFKYVRNYSIRMYFPRPVTWCYLQKSSRKIIFYSNTTRFEKGFCFSFERRRFQVCQPEWCREC